MTHDHRTQDGERIEHEQHAYHAEHYHEGFMGDRTVYPTDHSSSVYYPPDKNGDPDPRDGFGMAAEAVGLLERWRSWTLHRSKRLSSPDLEDATIAFLAKHKPACPECGDKGEVLASVSYAGRRTVPCPRRKSEVSHE